MLWPDWFVVIKTSSPLPHILVLYHITSDEDECSRLVTGCSTHATCTDTDGGFKCDCKPGYVGDGFLCTGKTTLYALYVIW